MKSYKNDDKDIGNLAEKEKRREQDNQKFKYIGLILTAIAIILALVIPLAVN